MQRMKKSVFIKAEKEIVFLILQDIKKFPEFIANIKSIKVKDRSETRQVSDWIVDLGDAEIVWSQADKINKDAFEIEFSMTEGDYTSYSGRWAVRKNKDKTELSIEVKIDWGIPGFEKVIGPTIEQKTKELIRGFLIAIKLRAEAAA